ncbi:MAG: hypothetical protein WCO98_15595 [bacterium]
MTNIDIPTLKRKDWPSTKIPTGLSLLVIITGYLLFKFFLLPPDKIWGGKIHENEYWAIMTTPTQDTSKAITVNNPSPAGNTNLINPPVYNKANHSVNRGSDADLRAYPLAPVGTPPEIAE